MTPGPEACAARSASRNPCESSGQARSPLEQGKPGAGVPSPSGLEGAEPQTRPGNRLRCTKWRAHVDDTFHVQLSGEEQQRISRLGSRQPARPTYSGGLFPRHPSCQRPRRKDVHYCARRSSQTDCVHSLWEGQVRCSCRHDSVKSTKSTLRQSTQTVGPAVHLLRGPRTYGT